MPSEEENKVNENWKEISEYIDIIADQAKRIEDQRVLLRRAANHFRAQGTYDFMSLLGQDIEQYLAKP